jgi:hypothetical protein
VRHSLFSSSGNLAKAQPAQTPQEHYLPLQTNSLQAKLATSGEHIMFAKTFRNTLIASTLVIAGSVLATPAMADTVTLGGSVASTSVVSSAATIAASALNLYGAGTAQTNVVVKVADMALITNNTAGVTLTAAGDAGLTNGTSTQVYQVLIVADAAAPPAATDFTSATDAKSVTDFSVGGAAARDLYIEYDAPALLDPGTYAAVITVSVADL